MRVAAVQFKARKGDKAASLSRLVELATRAGLNADLVVLPEMAATGYIFESPQAASSVAEEAASGPTFEAFSQVAASTGSWLVVGLPERAADGMLYNSALVIDPAGALSFTYRKTLLFDEDLTWAKEGDSGYRVFETGAGRFTVGICMDLNDDGFIQWCVDSDIHAVAFPTNWVQEGERPWGYWAWRARDIGAALVAANSYGVEAHTEFTGESAIIEGRTVLAAAPKTGDAVIWAQVGGQ